MKSSLYRGLPKSLTGSVLAVGIVVLQPVPVRARNETVIFAGGCYWGVESVFRRGRDGRI